MKLERIVCATIRMHLSESVYFTVQSCTTAFELWKKLSETYDVVKIFVQRRKT